MKVTNKFNLPQVFVNLLKRDGYSKGKADYSVTELINSPQIVHLTRKHWHQLEEDVHDRLWALMGTMLHKVLEEGKEEHHQAEERLHINFEGINISGAIDVQEPEDGKINIKDYKFTSVWAVMNEKIEWEQQLNMYAWFVEKVKGVEVNKLQIIAILRDWSKHEAKYKPDYPQSKVAVVDINLWPFQLREDYIRNRIHAHTSAHLSMELGEDLPKCTSADMWERPTTYAIKKKGNKRATTVCSNQEDAENVLADLGKGYAIEVRKGERVRCADYCQVNEYCKQYREYLKEQNENNNP